MSIAAPRPPPPFALGLIYEGAIDQTTSLSDPVGLDDTEPAWSEFRFRLCQNKRNNVVMLTLTRM